LAEGRFDELGAAFDAVARTRGRPNFGAKGKQLPPISPVPAPQEVAASIPRVPRAS